MKELKIEITKGHGPGGQNKNRRMTCVKVTHVQTGVTETCQDQRTQAQNKRIAIQRVKDRVAALNEEDAKARRGEQRLDRIKNPQRIRTYNFPRNEVVDHRTGRRAPLDGVLDGKLDDLL